MCVKQRVKVQGKILPKKDVNACKSHINRKLKACRNLFLSGKNSPSTHSSANGQILTRTLERKWLPNDRAIELLIRDWKLGTLNLAKIGTKISKRVYNHIQLSNRQPVPSGAPAANKFTKKKQQTRITKEITDHKNP